MVFDATQKGDGFAIDILRNIGFGLGKGLSIVVNFFNPQIIIIDGVLSKAQKLIVNPIKHGINKYCLIDFKEDLKYRNFITQRRCQNFWYSSICR
jgi:predicted NBD/HSP70 family sugar kinase